MQGLPQSNRLEKPKVIIFTEFAKMAQILHREFPNSLMIIGETPTEERQKIVEQFNSPDYNILIGTSAIAFGLNLQSAEICIHYDLPFSVAKYEQRAARAHRLGQRDTVFEYSLIANKTVDGYVKRKLNAKQDISERLMPVSELKEMLYE